LRTKSPKRESTRAAVVATEKVEEEIKEVEMAEEEIKEVESRKITTEITTREKNIDPCLAICPRNKPTISA
jgi:hypothetical protein